MKPHQLLRTGVRSIRLKIAVKEKIHPSVATWAFFGLEDNPTTQRRLKYSNVKRSHGCQEADVLLTTTFEGELHLLVVERVACRHGVHKMCLAIHLCNGGVPFWGQKQITRRRPKENTASSQRSTASCQEVDTSRTTTDSCDPCAVSYPQQCTSS